MIRTLEYGTFHIADISEFKKKMLSWLRPFGIFCYLDNQQYTIAPHQMECLVAAGVQDFITGDDIRLADEFLKEKRWAFGHLSYELQNAAHNLPAKEDKVGFPLFYFFHPQTVLEIANNELRIHSRNPLQV
ncbi:MAG TPA: hypothetical protein VF609_02115, partial [Flavisolibacter sp.]